MFTAACRAGLKKKGKIHKQLNWQRSVLPLNTEHSVTLL